MPTLIHNAVVFVSIGISLDQFALCAHAHFEAYADTGVLENLGHLLIDTDFPQPATEEFVRRVCTWGGYAGIAGRVLRDNQLDDICRAVREANEALNANCVADALNRINGLRHLGRPSFASKHLRFMRPDICPVFDSILRDSLPYSWDAEGYAAFSADCIELAQHLHMIPNPWNHPQWYAADVEASMYAYFNGIAV